MTDQPTTPAIDALEASGVPFRVVRTEIARSAEESAAFQGIRLGALLRSHPRAPRDGRLRVRARARRPAVRLAQAARPPRAPSRLTLPDADEAKAETGYERGAITPFGALRAWPVIVDASVESLDLVAIGGGARGVNVHIAPVDLIQVTGAEVVDISVPEPPAG